MNKYSIFFFVFFLVSCQANKHVSCPDFKNYETSSVGKQHSPKSIKKKKVRKQGLNQKTTQKGKQKSIEFNSINLLVGNLNLIDLLENESQMQGTISDSVCPIVVLQDQSVIYANVDEIQKDSLQISLCDSSGNSFKLSKSQVWSIEYLPEEFDLEESKQKMQKQAQIQAQTQFAPNLDESEYKRTRAMAINSLTFGLLSLLVWPLGLLALYLSIKAVRRYKNLHPEYIENKGIAIAGLVIGIITSLWTLFILLILIVNLIFVGF